MLDLFVGGVCERVVHSVHSTQPPSVEKDVAVRCHREEASEEGPGREGGNKAASAMERRQVIHLFSNVGIRTAVRDGELCAPYATSCRLASRGFSSGGEGGDLFVRGGGERRAWLRLPWEEPTLTRALPSCPTPFKFVFGQVIMSHQLMSMQILALICSLKCTHWKRFCTRESVTMPWFPWQQSYSLVAPGRRCA